MCLGLQRTEKTLVFGLKEKSVADDDDDDDSSPRRWPVIDVEMSLYSRSRRQSGKYSADSKHVHRAELKKAPTQKRTSSKLELTNTS